MSWESTFSYFIFKPIEQKNWCNKIPNGIVICLIARYLANLLERDECVKEESEVCETASPTVFTEACTNGNYVEVQFTVMYFISLSTGITVMFLTNVAMQELGGLWSGFTQWEMTERSLYLFEKCSGQSDCLGGLYKDGQMSNRQIHITLVCLLIWLKQGACLWRIYIFAFLSKLNL